LPALAIVGHVHGRLARLSLLAAAVLATVLPAGCSRGSAAPHGAAVPRLDAATPRLGGPTPAQQSPPERAMDRLERPVAARLARQVADEGLHLAYLDCPAWDGSLPRSMSCRGYVDGLVVTVRVLLRRAVVGSHPEVDFDAHLAGGLVATERLEETLRARGWVRADCGAVPAYPARAGTRIVCKVGRAGGAGRYVVATVRDRSGTVLIADYRAAHAGR
jgi:hypothetical protein